MKRNTTILILCGLLLGADLIWLRLMLDGRESLATLRASIAFAGQVLAAVTFMAVTCLVLRKKYARQKRPARRRESFGFLQPLRRLFVSVLS
jgi:hypothetical protein